MKNPKKKKTNKKKFTGSNVVDAKPKGMDKRKHVSKLTLTSFLGLESDELARLKQTPHPHRNGEITTTEITVSSTADGRQKRIPEVIVFHDPTKNTRKQMPAQFTDETKKGIAEDAQEGPVFNLKDASFEVRKYGIKGMKTEDKEAATVAMLVKLGAKPPKKAYVNYKVLQEKIKLEKEQQKQKLQDERDGEVAVKPTKPTKEFRQFKKTNRNDVGFIDGQIGRYKNGVQILSKTDLQLHDKRKLKSKN